MISEIFNTVFFQPIFNLLVFFHNSLPGQSIGLAIILLTVVVKLVLWPLSVKALRSQKALQDLQPKMEELKKKYPGKENQDTLAKEMMALYSREKVSPMSSCLPMLVQLPVFIAIYQSMARGLKSEGFEKLYPFIANPGTVDPTFLSFINLSAAFWPLAILAGITQFFQAKMMISKQQPKVEGSKDESTMAIMNKQMLYMMPALTVFICWSMPSGLTLYWLVMNILTIWQQYYFMRDTKKLRSLEAEKPRN